MRRASLICLPLMFLAVGCFRSSAPPESQQAVPYENFNQESYSNVSNYGPGSESSGAYYGTGSTPSEAPERTPAEPSVGGHDPY